MSGRATAATLAEHSDAGYAIVPDLMIGSGLPQGGGGTAMAQADNLRASIKICMFDQYGTVVDMQTGLTEAAAPSLRRRGGRAIPILS